MIFQISSIIYFNYIIYHITLLMPIIKLPENLLDKNKKLEFSEFIKINNICTSAQFLQTIESWNINKLHKLNYLDSYLAIKTFNGETVLHIASRLGYVDIVKLLLTEKADINAKAYLNFTPLHMAIRDNKK